MPRVTVDLSEAQSRTPVPDATYPAKVVEINGPHKGAKSTYLTHVVEITEGEYSGRKFFHNTPITGAGAGIFADFVGKLTGQEIDVDAEDALDIDTDDLIGLPLGIVTKQEEYPEGSGEMQSKIARVLKAR